MPEQTLKQIIELLTEACVKLEAPLPVDSETYREVAAHRGRVMRDVYALVETALMAAQEATVEAQGRHRHDRLCGAVQWWTEKLADGATGQDAEDMLAVFAEIAEAQPLPARERADGRQ